MTREEVLKMSEGDFFTHIITTICDYAQINGYAVTDMIKTMGENLMAITEIANFDNWKVSEEDD